MIEWRDCMAKKPKLITEDLPSSGSWQDASKKKRRLKERESTPDRVVERDNSTK